jgi:hypothetical protein
MRETIVEHPIIGPFLEPNRLSGSAATGTHLGVSIRWSTGTEVMSVDLVRSHQSSIWRDIVVLDQFPHYSIELLLLDLFPRNFGLLEFLAEIEKWVKVGESSPLPSQASEWLHPHLVELGFSVAPSHAHAKGVTTPLVWIYPSARQSKSSPRRYVRVDFVEWSPDTICRRGVAYQDCGFGALSLLRLLNDIQLGAECRLLTEMGEKRMRELFDRRQDRIPVISNLDERERLSAADKVSLKKLRCVFDSTGADVSKDSECMVIDLSDFGYRSLLTHLARKGDDLACSALLLLRRPRPKDLADLLRVFVEKGLSKSVSAAVAGTRLRFDRHDFRRPTLPEIAVHRSDLLMLQLLLQSADSVSVTVLEWLFNSVLKSGNKEIEQFLATTPEIEPIREAAMLDSFHWQTFYSNWSGMLRLLELGLRPIHAASKRTFFHFNLLTAGAKPVLERICQLEPVTDKLIREILRGCPSEGTPEFEWFLALTKSVPGHQQRMSDELFHRAISFLRFDDRINTGLFLRFAREGGTLGDFPPERFVDLKLLHGRGWQRRQNNLIELNRFLIGAGLRKDVAALKAIRRNPKPNDVAN